MSSDYEFRQLDSGLGYYWHLGKSEKIMSKPEIHPYAHVHIIYYIMYIYIYLGEVSLTNNHFC